jgi:hypothetical protein
VCAFVRLQAAPALWELLQDELLKSKLSLLKLTFCSYSSLYYIIFSDIETMVKRVLVGYGIDVDAVSGW